MKITKIEEIALIESIEDGPLPYSSVEIFIDGIPEDSVVSVRRNGNPKTDEEYRLVDGCFTLNVIPSNYAIKIENSIVRFVVVNTYPGVLLIQRAKEEPQKAVETIFKLFLKMEKRISEMEDKISSMSGYQTE